MIDLDAAARATGFRERQGCRSKGASPAIPDAFNLWRSRAALLDEERWKRRLRTDDLDPIEVLSWFAGTLPPLATPPPWLAWLWRVPASESSGGVEVRPFARVLTPFIQRALADLRERLADHSGLDVESVFGETAQQQLAVRLFDLSARVFVFEMHEACAHPRDLGETPEARYDAFVSWLVADGLARVLDRYPVLARLLSTTCSSWIASATELIDRLRTDAPVLRAWSGTRIDRATLRRAESHLGDPHRGGRTVWHLVFDQGSIIYKPRSLAVDAAFQSLLDWFNRRGVAYPFRLLGVLDRGSHGWMESVSTEECADAEAARRFFHRLGGLVGLVHLLEGTDFHSTNLIAAGEHPMLIDLEGLFHPRLNRLEGQTPSEAAQRFLNDSPLRTGLLPTWQNEAPDRPGIDISGAGADPDQLVRRRVWEHPFTSDMRLGVEWQPRGLRPNHVICGGHRVPPVAHAGEIVDGFREVLELAVRRRSELLTADGPIHAFAECATRFIFQNTAPYQVLLEASLHPAFLQNGIDRDAALDRLWITATDDPRCDPLLAAARNDLWHGDFPYFRTTPGGRDVETPQGVVAGVLDEPPLSTVLQRIRSAGADETERHTALIRASLATTGASRGITPEETRLPAIRPDDEGDWLAGAVEVGELLLHSALHHEAGTTWTGIVFAGRNWRIAPLPATLYDGLSGVILFLAYIGSATGDQRFSILRDQATRSLVSQLDEARFVPAGVGAFTGWAGILYLVTHLEALEPGSIAGSVGVRCLDEIEQGIDTDHFLDWVDGVAGCAAVLLGRYESAGDERALHLARCCGERLVAMAERCQEGLGWRRPEFPVPLAGMAHGASGVALALARLARVTGDSRFLVVALGALQYERSLFDPGTGNWPDLRDSSTGPSSMTAWCHGAPGIGMARVALADLDERLGTEAEVAVDAVRASDFGCAPCLCHGDFGNLDLLLQAGHVREARAIATAIGKRHPTWVYGDPIYAHSPGLMTGLAGIGYQLLRLARLGAVPSPLVLAPPQPRLGAP